MIVQAGEFEYIFSSASVHHMFMTANQPQQKFTRPPKKRHLSKAPKGIAN
jgi:hypothetical protein